MKTQPRIDPYPEPVALSALSLAPIHRKQAENGRTERLRRLARRNRDVAWLLDEVERFKQPLEAPATDQDQVQVGKTQAQPPAQGRKAKAADAK